MQDLSNPINILAYEFEQYGMTNISDKVCYDVIQIDITKIDLKRTYLICDYNLMSISIGNINVIGEYYSNDWCNCFIMDENFDINVSTEILDNFYRNFKKFPFDMYFACDDRFYNREKISHATMTIMPTHTIIQFLSKRNIIYNISDHYGYKIKNYFFE